MFKFLRGHTVVLLIITLIISSCALPIKNLYPPHTPEETRVIYVVSHGWHTGIVIDKSDIPNNLIPEKLDFADSKYLEIGWGDSGFYQAPNITVALTLQALFTPTKSVMHVVGLKELPEKEFLQSEIIQLNLSDKGLFKLIEKVHESFERGKKNKSIILRNGLYKDSKFYPAKGYYHAFRTCNNWTGEMLRSSGMPITTLYTFSAGNVIDQTYRRGKIIRMNKIDKLF